MNDLKLFAELIEIMTIYQLTVGEDDRYATAKQLRETWLVIVIPTGELKFSATRCILDMNNTLAAYE